MTPDELLGIPNMEKFLKESKYEIAFENTIFHPEKPGILVLEEFMDVDPSTAACLKDIITEGGWRHGDTKIESKILSIFITGNVDPDEKALDDTTKALYEERFPLRERVIWSSFQRGDYFELLRSVYDDNTINSVVSELCAYTTSNSNIVSPRVALYAAKVANSVGLEFLYKIDKLDCSMLQEYIDTSTTAISIEQQRIKIKEAKKQAISIHNNATTLIEFVKAQYTIEELLKQKIEYHDALVEEIREFHAFLKIRLNMIVTSIGEEIKADDNREVIDL